MKRLTLLFAISALLLLASLGPRVVSADSCENNCLNQSLAFQQQCYAATHDETACSQAGSDMYYCCVARVCHAGVCN